MARPIIEVRQIAKCYQLGGIGLTSLRAEVERWWGRNDPNAPRASAKHEFWALRDVSFDVQPGEVIGIIGRNGAGKSTLLKIMGEITEPTLGEIRLRGRTASLLEVGTGFHPEISGRENIFLNGAILGMRRAEIAKKFDAIVAFAEVEKFLDTPVKRYSSGMYVRLAFAVAAHLDPEILIIDEVLAVGDQAFQQKCLGKMQEVSRQEGRTVLFVSHNMAAVSRLCHRAILLEGGGIAGTGPAGEVVERYLAQASASLSHWVRPPELSVSGKAVFASAWVRDALGAPASVLPFPSPITLDLECLGVETTAQWVVRVSIYDRQGNELLCAQDSEATTPHGFRPGERRRLRCVFPGGVLRPGTYVIGVAAHELAGDALVGLYEEVEPLVTFEISVQGFGGQSGRGMVAAQAAWSFGVSDMITGAVFTVDGSPKRS